MKVALITDTHFGCRSSSPAFHEYHKRCFKWFIDYIDQEQIKTVIHLGDCFDVRKHVNYISAKLAREVFFEPLNERGVKTHMIVGNHDLYFRNTNEVSSLYELVKGRYENIFVYDKPHLLNLDGLDIQLMPWISESNYDVSMEAINKPRAPILMGHLELNGFQMFRGAISDHGMDRNAFDKFDTVYSGHYHHRSTIGNVSYLGSFMEITWSDYDDDRGFTTLDTNTRETSFLRNPYRMFRLAKYDDVANPNIIDKIQKTDFSKYKDTYVKLVVVNKTNPFAFDLLFDSIYKASPLDITIIEDPTVLLDSEEDLEVDEAEDTATILRKYIGGLTLPVDGDRMKEFMLDVYNEALQVETV